VTAHLYGITLVGEAAVWPFRAALYVAVRIRPGGQIVAFGPYSMN